MEGGEGGGEGQEREMLQRGWEGKRETEGEGGGRRVGRHSVLRCVAGGEREGRGGEGGKREGRGGEGGEREGSEGRGRIGEGDVAEGMEKRERETEGEGERGRVGRQWKKKIRGEGSNELKKMDNLDG